MTSKLTLDILRQNGVLTVWLPTGDRQKERVFLYAATWLTELHGLPAGDGGTPLRPRPSMSDKVQALVDAFVAGEPLAAMIRPRGQGMSPIFQRLRPPDRAVVEMRTRDTRTFGFIAPGGTYVALCVYEATTLKRDDPGYAAPIARVRNFVKRLIPTEVDEETNAEEFP